MKTAKPKNRKRSIIKDTRLQTSDDFLAQLTNMLQYIFNRILNSLKMQTLKITSFVSERIRLIISSPHVIKQCRPKSIGI